jgi:hypothetical protein
MHYVCVSRVILMFSICFAPESHKAIGLNMDKDRVLCEVRAGLLL